MVPPRFPAQITLDVQRLIRELSAATNSIPMGNILVLFHSKSGNTAKMAAEVAEGAKRIPGMEVRLRPVAEATAEAVRWCHGIAVGSPVNMGILAWEMKQFWDTKMKSELWRQRHAAGCDSGVHPECQPSVCPFAAKQEQRDRPGSAAATAPGSRFRPMASNPA